MLILTLKGALPNVLRFLFCAILIYLGFVFCGWIILGPYHFKFKTILTTSECLFSLINGDDMFATFSSTPSDSAVIWTFSKIYLYIFISLFIYVILSLFIAIIMDTYEVIKDYYANGFPKKRLHEFYKEAGYDPRSGVFRRNPPEVRNHPTGDGNFNLHSLADYINGICQRFHRDNNDGDASPNERSPLLT